MIKKLNYILFIILLFINIKYSKTFTVNFHNNYNLRVEPFHTQVYKRELMQFFDQASFSFNGFQKIESVPVLFPIDICVFSLEDSKYATTLHMKTNGTRHFEVFRMNNGSYELIADIPSPKGIAMDCINFNNKGYIALALNLTEPIQSAKEGSPIYEISGNYMRAVQYFSTPNLTSVYLRTSGNEFFLLHTYASSKETPHLHCPFYKWSGSTFNNMGRIPCSNARQLTPFSIDYESYVAVANYADQNGHTSTNSEIYKYSPDKNKFLLFQKIPTNGAVDAQYFNVPQNVARRHHFLVFGNSINTDSSAKSDGKNLDADSVFYLFDKGQFIPYQKLSFYGIKKFLPMQSIEAEKFILLVACTDQDIKIYNFNDWKFEESRVQFTEGALGKGVSNMRTYQENEKSYLIIANNLMTDNETNIFLPIFKQEEHANALRQKIINWAKTETQRLKTVNTKELGKRVEDKLRSLDRIKYLRSMQDISHSNIETVITESLVYPKLHMTADYWMALNYIKQALDTLEVMLEQKQKVKRDTIFNFQGYKNLEYANDTLNVKTLTINKNIKAKSVNGVNATKPHFENILATKVIVKDTSIRPPNQERTNLLENLDEYENNVLTVKNLQINGKVNNYQLHDLFNNTLKRKGKIQFLKGPVVIENLKTNTIEVRNDKVNEQDLGALVPLNGGKYVIDRDIKFTAPITVNKLHILERLNSIHVLKGQFDVLLKNSNKTQVIEGIQNVVNIKVLEPVTGKIIGRQLETMVSKKFIDEALVLQGNFIINGNVYINHQLNALDLIDLNEKCSTKQILYSGIRLDKSLKDVNIKFQQHLIANNSLVNFVNQHDMQSLVKLNVDGIQVIEGFKQFNNSLEIRSGLSEVKNLNGVDMEKLEKNTFLKHNNQTIKVPITMGNITTKTIESSIIILNTRKLTDYLTITGNQSIEGSLLVNNLKANVLTMEYLNTDCKIFNQDLQDIYQRKFHNAPQEDVLKNKRKFHGSIYVQNLILNSTINNKPVEIIENQLLQLEGNIKYVGNFKFNYPMNVTIMTFQGKLNGIKAEDFGKYWLQKKAKKQVFTAAQTFATINAGDGIFLQGKLNGFYMDEFYTKTYRINRDEYIQCVNFENPIDISNILNTKTLNDYDVPNDVFIKNSKKVPNFLESMIVKENFFVEGYILNLTSINKINLSDLQLFLDITDGQTLYVENAYFIKSPPLYKTLCSHDVSKTLENTWLANENVIIPHLVEIADAKFEGLLNFEGSINNISLDYLKENYVSKTKPQYISVEVIFPENVESENEINLSELTVFGTLRELKSGVLLNFNEFERKSLKTLGPHIISGDWYILEARIDGSLNDVLVNHLNLLDDTLRKDEIFNYNKITAPKVFKNVHIEKLYADSLSLVNKIPIADWIRDTVYLYENYTIAGVTTLNSINVYNNLLVFGSINDIKFNENNILLTNKNQRLLGSIKIKNYLSQEKRFLTNNIEHLYTEYINGKFVPTFVENLIPVTEKIEINSRLTFKNVLKVEKYDGPEGFLTQNQLPKRSIDGQIQKSSQEFQKTNYSIKKFEVFKNYLNNISKSAIYKFHHFDVLQNISLKFGKLAMFSIKLEDNRIVDILAISNMYSKNVTILTWMPNEKAFRKTNEFNWLPYEPLSFKIIQERFQSLQQPIEVGSLKSFISHELKIFHNVLVNAGNSNNYIDFSNQSCMLFASRLQTSLALKKFCLKAQNSEKIIDSTDILQMLSLGQNEVVLLTNNSAIFYDIRFNSSKLIQKLALVKPKEMALASFKILKFLAVLNRGQYNGSNNNFVEIYRSVNSSSFIFFQSLKVFENPSSISFSFLKKSNDFLLHILTNSLNTPYIVYQYQGVMGFREILTDSTLSEKFVDLDILNLHSSEQQLVALKALEHITFVEFILN